MALISIFSISFVSPLLRFHTSELVNSAERFMASCSSIRTDVSTVFNVAFEAIVLIETVDAIILFFLTSMFFPFVPSSLIEKESIR